MLDRELVDEWIKTEDRESFQSRWESNSVGDLLRSMPPRELWTAASEESIADACARMKEHGVSQLPVVENGKLLGMIAESDVLSRIVDGRSSLQDTVAEVMLRDAQTVQLDDDAVALTALFAGGFVGVVVDDEQNLKGIITKLDLVDFLTSPIESPK